MPPMSSTRLDNRLLFVLDYMAEYEETSTTALSANPHVAVPLFVINGWILMQRRVIGSSVSFNRTWAEYRDGFGSAAGNDNYWLGLDKIYRLMQLGNVTLRVEVRYTDTSHTNTRTHAHTTLFLLSNTVDEMRVYRTTHDARTDDDGQNRITSTSLITDQGTAASR